MNYVEVCTINRHSTSTMLVREIERQVPYASTARGRRNHSRMRLETVALRNSRERCHEEEFAHEPLSQQWLESRERLPQLAHGGVHLYGGPQAQLHAVDQLLARGHEQLHARQARQRGGRARAGAGDARHQRPNVLLPTHVAL